MTKPRTTSENSTADENRPAVRERPESQPGYFLSLSVENVRCFGPKQTLDLSDGNGKPARWTILFGVNGTGKTTVLQSLVLFEKMPLRNAGLENVRLDRFFALLWEDRQTFQRSEKQKATWTAKLAVSQTLVAPPIRIDEHHFVMPSEKGINQG